MKKKKIKEEQKDGQIKGWKKKIAWAWIETMIEVFCWAFEETMAAGTFFFLLQNVIYLLSLKTLVTYFLVRIVYYPT
jgi:hypothetical protein